MENKYTPDPEKIPSRAPRKVRLSRKRPTQEAQSEYSSSIRRPIFRSDQAAPPKKPFVWRVWARRILAGAATCLIIWIVFISNWLDIRGFEVRNSTSISAEDVEKVYQAYLKQHPNERNFFFFNERQFSKAVLTAYPTVNNVNINRTLFFKMVVSLTESNAALIWQVGNTNWILGDDGRVLAISTGAEKRLGTVRDTAQLQIKAGDKVVDRNFVSFVRTIYALAPEYKLTIESVEVGNATSEVTLRLANNIIAKCDTTRGAREELDAIAKTFETAERTNIPVTQYIDARIPGRTYYK